MMDRRARGTAAALKSADVIAASQLLAQLGLSGFELCSLFFFFSIFFSFFIFFWKIPNSSCHLLCCHAYQQHSLQPAWEPPGPDVVSRPGQTVPKFNRISRPGINELGVGAEGMEAGRLLNGCPQSKLSPRTNRNLVQISGMVPKSLGDSRKVAGGRQEVREEGERAVGAGTRRTSPAMLLGRHPGSPPGGRGWKSRTEFKDCARGQDLC